MAEFADQVRLFLEQIIARLGYGGIVLAAILETAFPPLPSDLVVPAAGLLAARGELHMAGIVMAATCGSLIGALVLYAVGRRAGEPLTRKLIRRYGRWLLLRETALDKVNLRMPTTLNSRPQYRIGCFPPYVTRPDGRKRIKSSLKRSNQ